MCLEKLIQYNDSHQARERINKRKNTGTTIKERLSKFQKLSAGNIIKAGANRLRKDLVDIAIERRLEKERLQQDKLDALRSQWEQMLLAHSAFKEQNKNQSLWTAKDYEIALCALRQDEAEKIPKRKQQMMDLCNQWKDRTPLSTQDITLDSMVCGRAALETADNDGCCDIIDGIQTEEDRFDSVKV